MRNVATKRRLVAVAAVLGFGIAAVALYAVERKRSGLASEVEWLRTRLAERRREIARQRAALVAVGGAVDRLARVTLETRDRAGKARSLAKMAPTDGSPQPRVRRAVAEFPIADDGQLLVDRIDWIEDQLTTTDESVGVLAALVEDRTRRSSRGSVPSVWPVRGIVTSRFGPRTSPYGDGGEMHSGIDIMGRYGAAVAAAGDGEVIFAGRDSGYGAVVIVAHPGDIRTMYAHLSVMYVREGQRVKRGQAIGTVGASGRATGPHLHYEVRVAGVPVDPRRYLVN